MDVDDKWIKVSAFHIGAATCKPAGFLQAFLLSYVIIRVGRQYFRIL